MGSRTDRHHPDTNTDEGHLGGYIRSVHSTASRRGLPHGDPATWTPGVWDWCRDQLNIESMLDVGCGEGHAARYWLDKGCRVLGVDGSVQARRDSRIPDRHVVHDYAKGPYNPQEPFDLVWSCEFVEHVEERYVENFMATFAAGNRYLLMTYAPPGQPGYHHVNCQTESYWIERIEAIGFRLDRARSEMTRQLAPRTHYGSRGLFFSRGWVTPEISTAPC